MKKNILTAVLAAVTSPLLAVNLQTFRFSDSYRYSVLDDSLLEKFSGNYVLTASFSHIHSPVSITNTNYNISNGLYLKQFNAFTFSYTYYLRDNITIAADTLINRNRSDDETSYFMGDTVLKSKINFFKENGWSFSLNPQVFLPTGARNSFSSVDEVAGSLSAVAEKHLSSNWHILGSVGYFTGRKNIYDVIDYRDLLLAQLGLSYDINDSWNANFETYRNFVVRNDYGQDEGTYFLTMKHKTTSFLSTYFGAGAAGLSRLDRDNYTLFAGLKFSEAAKKVEVIIQPTPREMPKPKVTKRDEEKKLGILQQVEHIYFDNGSSAISGQQAVKIDTLVKAYNKNPDIKHIVIEGYASKTGTAQLNQRLSEERAGKVRSYLASHGIPESKLSVVAYGDAALKQYPTEAANRRVEFRIYK